ncbi:MAG: methionyl-tRNA formyltransferase [Candidatus Omnitrophica bacterium]|nr:methionyl-tRNA formyltransferase [Candidatus Omnitrophota bacterium]
MPILHRLIDSKHRMLILVTQPDREKGRDLKISPSQTKVLALTKNIPVYQPTDASSRESIGYLKKFNADLFVVAAFGQILKKEALEIPKIYSINIHGSLLPKYRGAAPTNWAIINDDKTSGVTIIKMNEKMDEGDIILKKEIAIDPEDTNITLSEKLSALGADSSLEAIGLIESNQVKFIKQDDSHASYAPKLKKADGLINWGEAAAVIHNKVRGLLPWPGAYTHFNGRILKILKTEAVQDDKAGAKNGEVTAIVKNKGMVVKAGKGSLLVKHVQIEGKKAMESEAFLRGHRIEPGYIFVVL